MSSAPNNAAAQLDRILYIIPRAARDGGARVEDLAAELGVSSAQVHRDLEELTDRAYYLPAGAGDDLQILIEHDVVRIWTTRELRRPSKLSPLEALALALGFRVLAAQEHAARRAELLAHAHRLEDECATGPIDELLARFAIDPGDRGEGGILATLRAAARERRWCRIQYFKPDAENPEERVVAPYTILSTGEAGYILGYCRAREGVRLFRADRTLDATPLPETFEVPADFDPEEWLAHGGQVYRATAEREAVVRYSPRIARWLREQGPVEEQDDGSVLIRHRVADLRWLLRHVLQYVADAEILEPRELRELLRDTLEAALDSGNDTKKTEYTEMPNANTRTADETRRLILQAAAELFAARGYEAVTIREIARAAKRSHTTVYTYFADKEALLHELSAPPLESLKQRLEEILARGAGPLPGSPAGSMATSPEENLKEVSREFIRFCLGNRSMYDVFFNVGAGPVDEAEPALPLNRLRNALFGLLLRALRLALPPCDDDRLLALGRIYFFLLRGIVGTYTHSAESADVLMERLEPTFDEAATVLLRGFTHRLEVGDAVR
jgi:predicted DNA-binding transcriptional regulator YafY/AcrR family transcriptional regulator